MTFVFKVEGGPSIGMGHVTRSMALAREARRRGHRVAGFVANGDPRSIERIRASFPCATGGLEAMAALVRSSRASVVVIDQPKGQRQLAAGLRMKFPALYLVALDHFDMKDDKVSMIVTLLNHAATKRPLSQNVRFHEGVRFGILREGFSQLTARRRAFSQRPGKVLVTFGGADPSGHTAAALSALGKGESSFTLNVVIGPNFRSGGSIRREASRAPRPVRISSNVANMAGLMSRSDVAVSGGGTTLMELACVGTPAVVVPQSRNEGRFAGLFASKGAAVVCRREPRATFAGRLSRAVSSLLGDRRRRARMSAAQRRLVDGRGAGRIISLIEREARRAGTQP